MIWIGVGLLAILTITGGIRWWRDAREAREARREFEKTQLAKEIRERKE